MTDDVISVMLIHNLVAIASQYCLFRPVVTFREYFLEHVKRIVTCHQYVL